MITEGGLYNENDADIGAIGENAIFNFLWKSGYSTTTFPHGIYKDDYLCKSSRERFYVSAEGRGDVLFDVFGNIKYPDVNVFSRRLREKRDDIIFAVTDINYSRVAFVFGEDAFAQKDVVHFTRRGNDIVRKVPIERVLVLDALKPIKSTIAELNAERVRLVCESRNVPIAVKDRTLRGLRDCPLAAPYGMCDHEWLQLIRQLVIAKDLRPRRDADFQKQSSFL